jgi:hypothetical protein
MPDPTKKELVGLAVKLEVLTKDRLRKFIFGIQKTQKNDTDAWSVDFELLDRPKDTGDFTRIVFLDVDLDLKKVAAADVDATASKGFNKGQVEFVLSSVASDADKLKAGKIKDSRLKKTIGDLFAARNG